MQIIGFLIFLNLQIKAASFCAVFRLGENDGFEKNGRWLPHDSRRHGRRHPSRRPFGYAEARLKNVRRTDDQFECGQKSCRYSQNAIPRKV